MLLKNEKQLEAVLLKKCETAIRKTEEKVYGVISKTLNDFYNNWKPEEYIRTEQLLRSLVRSGIEPDGKNGFKAEVYFDVSLLNYEQGVMPLQHTPEHGMYGWATWDGQKVLDVAMTDSLPHGRYAGASYNVPIWNHSMFELGNIFVLLEKNLKARGIPIKK